MLAGKQFKRGVRGITLAYEAMLELYLTAFLRGVVNGTSSSQKKNYARNYI